MIVGFFGVLLSPMLWRSYQVAKEGFKMSRKDFEFIASQFKWQSASREFCLSFGTALMLNNERFDLARFMRACGHPVEGA